MPDPHVFRVGTAVTAYVPRATPGMLLGPHRETRRIAPQDKVAPSRLANSIVVRLQKSMRFVVVGKAHLVQVGSRSPGSSGSLQLPLLAELGWREHAGESGVAVWPFSARPCQDPILELHGARRAFCQSVAGREGLLGRTSVVLVRRGP